MEYIKVESSQIDSVGYGEGLYGPETLALRFPPTKKQKAAGENGSEYHYGGVSQEQHRALMDAESVGTYFGKFIKSSPHLYPFTKVEADPMQPSVGAASNTQAVQEDTNGDQPSPGTALALINNMDDNLLFTPGKITDEQLTTMRSDWLAEAKKYDISTETKRTELKRFAQPLQKLRTGIEARAKELTGATKRKIAAIDTEKRRLVLIVGNIEDEVLAPLTTWKQEEEARKTRLAGEVSKLVEMGQPQHYANMAIDELGMAIALLERFDVSTMQEYKLSAESAIAASLRVLKPELERRKVAEAERVELERLRAESAARAEADRIFAAAKKLADEQIQAAVEAAKVETRQEVIAELAAPPTMEEIADEPAEEEPHLALIPEIPVKDKCYGLVGEDQELTHRQRFNAEAVEALMGCALTRQEAIAVLTAITKGRIPHVTISY